MVLRGHWKRLNNESKKEKEREHERERERERERDLIDVSIKKLTEQHGVIPQINRIYKVLAFGNAATLWLCWTFLWLFHKPFRCPKIEPIYQRIADKNPHQMY